MTSQIPLAYRRSGNKPVLVLVHGFPLDGTIWDNVIPLLEDDFDVIVPDLRGFGGSESVDETYTLTDMAGDIVALMDRLGVSKAVIAGHSMGGYLSLALAKKYTDRVSALALVSSQAGADTEERKQGRYATAEKVAADGTGVVVDAMAPGLAAVEHVRAQAREIMERQSAAGVIGGLKAMAEREDLRPAVAGFEFPVLVVHGDADAILPVALARETAGLSGSVGLVEIPGAGHLPMMENPEATAAALKRLK